MAIVSERLLFEPRCPDGLVSFRRRRVIHVREGYRAFQVRLWGQRRTVSAASVS